MQVLVPRWLMVSDVMRAALEELQEMAEHAEQVHLMAVRFGVNQTTFAIVQAAAVRGVVEKDCYLKMDLKMQKDLVMVNWRTKD